MQIPIGRILTPAVRVAQWGMKSWSELEAIFARTAVSYGMRKSTATEQFKEYRAWIFTSVNAINHRFKSIPFSIMRSDSGRELDKEEPSYDTIMRPFQIPNRFQSFRELKSFMQLQYDITGAAYTLILRNRLGMPAGLWCLLSSDFVQIHRGDTTTDYLKAFEFRNGAVYPESEIIYFHHPDPRDPLLSMSPIQALALETDISYYTALYERDMFEKGAVPDIVLSSDKRMDPERIAALQERWQEKYGGPKKFHGVAVVDGGLKPTPISVPTKDLEMIELAKWNQDTILSAYQVPAGKVGLVRDVNKANAYGIDVTFNSECIWPRLMDFDEAFTRAVLWKFDQRLYMEHDNPIPRDKEFELDESFRKVHAGIWSRNEARRFMDGLEGIGPGGDEIRVNLAEVAIGSAPPFEEDEDLAPAGPPSLEDIVEPEPSPSDPYRLSLSESGADEVRFLMGKADPATKEGRDAIYKQVAKRAKQVEEVWYPLLDRFFGKQREEVLRRLKEHHPKLVRNESEKRAAIQLAAVFWTNITIGKHNNRLKVFLESDMRAMATTNGSLDKDYFALVQKWFDAEISQQKLYENIEEYYNQKRTKIINEIVFDIAAEAQRIAPEARRAHEYVYRIGGQEGIADAYVEYIQAGG